MKLEEYIKSNVECYFELGVSLVETINIFVYKFAPKNEDLEKIDLIISLCVEIYQKYKNNFQRKECSNFCEAIIDDIQRFPLKNGYNLLCRDILVQTADAYYGDYDYHIYAYGLEDENENLVIPTIFEKIIEKPGKIYFTNKHESYMFDIFKRSLNILKRRLEYKSNLSLKKQ